MKKNKCYWCGKEIKISHRDHIIPKIVSTNRSKYNFKDICQKCNLSKNKNIWIKDDDGKIIIFNKPKQFISVEETKTSKKVVIKTVYTYKKPYQRIRKKEYSKFGIELNVENNLKSLEKAFQEVKGVKMFPKI